MGELEGAALAAGVVSEESLRAQGAGGEKERGRHHEERGGHIFYSKDKLWPVVQGGKKDGATREADRLLRVSLRRKTGRGLELMVWHGAHEEGAFGLQLTALTEATEAGEGGVVMG